jgi:hypothetical protein
MVAADLRGQYEQIEAISDRRQRGLAFEDFIVDLFAASHFQVEKNAGAARPRQTDLLAVRAGDMYLIECKWHSSRADVDGVDNLRSRLARTSGAIGVLISIRGFSGTAISEVAGHRQQPILLLSGDGHERAGHCLTPPHGSSYRDVRTRLCWPSEVGSTASPSPTRSSMSTG